jgi:fido (protein-threonine AMPylation protein)
VRSPVWYNNYDALRAEVEAIKANFIARCRSLKIDPVTVEGEFNREIISRAVHESNWQEGIELDQGRTQELANAAFDDIEEIAGPHLDMNKLLRIHRDTVLRFKSDSRTVEEIATFNLARAYLALQLIYSELVNRQTASLAHALKGLEPFFANVREKMPSEVVARIQRGFDIIESLTNDATPITTPYTAPPRDLGHLVSELLKLDFADLLNPMRVDYIHFLHKLVLMGISPVQVCGKFRKTSVHVGNPNLYFPVPSAVPELMREYCQKFPCIPSNPENDLILIAANVSHRFACIHPYRDGNGRVSRLLMNLVLRGHFPFVYLKADKKGRHRYSQSLRRADRGNIKPLASLICMSLIEIYQKLLRSIS